MVYKQQVANILKKFHAKTPRGKDVKISLLLIYFAPLREIPTNGIYFEQSTLGA
jgi:hypothetical protein